MAICLLATLMLMGGCQPRQRDDPGTMPSELSFAQQAAEIRAGRASQVRLDDTLVRDADLKLLDGIESKVKRINLSRTEISDEGMARLARLANLEQLRLASRNVTDEGLAKIEDLRHLRFLHLLDMPITDAGLDHLHGLKTLESLYLDRTRVTDDGIARLLAALPKVHLHIDEHHHPLDPHGKKHTH